jgi:WD40 repeat protein
MCPRGGRLFVQANDLRLTDNAGCLTLTVQGGARSTEDAPSPSPTNVEAAEIELLRLVSRAAAPQESSLEEVRRDLLNFGVRWPGTFQAMWAAGILRQLASPLDGLEPSRIAPGQRVAGQPRELVAVLGQPSPEFGTTESCVAFDLLGKRIAAGGTDHLISLWELSGKVGRLVLRGHLGPVTSIAFSPDGRALVSASDDWTLRLWDVTTQKPLGSFEGHRHWVRSVAFSADGGKVLSASWDKSLRLWEVTTGRELCRFLGHTDGVTSAALSADGRFALSGSLDQTVRLWDVGTGRELRRLEGHKGAVSKAVFSPDGRSILSASWDRTVRIWDISGAEAREQALLKRAPITSLALAPDGTTLAATGDDGRVVLWDLASRNKLQEWKLPRSVWGIAFAPDCRHLATANADGTIYILRISPCPAAR